ncbi:hypothetical protein PV371_12670 [Streptomyces sp. TX20-6-3]|uniref:hypothetical protein n=1 Tax=Streptomyces sp. TX20-6-3 TaxID=3028705 RepID=UPI0029BF4A8D|nr:hypothetical protein [Streptomyces sp. TX20-6-3]MDX2560496.1 hypothetical protein [Streptomyces sp. TX20-6-3]
MTQNAEKGLLHTGPSRKDSAASGKSAVTVPQEEPSFDPGDIVELWADARALYLAGVYPKYASPAWLDLHPDDPRRLAGALDAAENWRKYGDEEALMQWFLDVNATREPLWSRRTLAELDALAKHRRPHEVVATPGWPPVKVPGTETWRHNIDGRQVDLDHNIPRPAHYQEAA